MIGLTTTQHKQFKGLSPKHNLADHKTRMELILSSLAEETATGLHQKNDSQGYAEIETDVKEAGDTAAQARLAVEQRLGEPVVSSQSFLDHTKERQKKSLPSPGQKAGKKQHKKANDPEQETLF